METKLIVDAQNIAIKRVQDEDNRDLVARQNAYLREIRNAFIAIDTARAAGKKEVSLYFDSGTPDTTEGGRVRAALIELGFICTEFESQKGRHAGAIGYQESHVSMIVTIK